MAKHAGAHLEKCVACELKLGERVGRIPVCVSLLPECGRHGVGLLSVELRADNHQGSHPAPGAVGELKEQSTSKQQARAEAASCTAILSCWAAFSLFSREGRLYRATATQAYLGRHFRRQRSCRGRPGLLATDIPEGKVQGTAGQRRSQFRCVSDTLSERPCGS